MRVSIFGLGYVGCTLMACLASDGHTVIGVESDRERAEQIRAGRLPLADHDLNTVYLRHRDRTVVVTDPIRAVIETDVTFVCVGTPQGADGFDLRQLTVACEKIGQALALKDGPHLVAVKSTMLPGTLRTVVQPLLERRSGKRAGAEFGLCANPEFLREGAALSDFYRPPFTVVGMAGGDTPDNRPWIDQLKQVFEWVLPPVIVVEPETAEMLKLACNAFHALKVCFANEIGNLCRAEGVDSRAVMDLFVRDTKLNVSSAYLRPGFAYGGSCLPKDVAALAALADRNDLAAPLLRAIPVSNDDQIDQVVLAIQKLRRLDGPYSVGVLGLAHKPGTDDFRHSPARRLMNELRRAGFQVVGYDPHSPFDAERELAPVLGCDVIVLTSAVAPAERLSGLGTHQVVVDLAGVLAPGQTAARMVRIT